MCGLRRWRAVDAGSLNAIQVGLRASALVGMAEHTAIEDDWLRVTALIAMVGWGVAEQKRRRRFEPAAQCL